MSCVKELEGFPGTPLGSLLRSFPALGLEGLVLSVAHGGSLPCSRPIADFRKVKRDHRALCIQSAHIQVMRLRDPWDIKNL